MSKKRQPTRDNALKRVLRTPLFRQRIVSDKTRYHRTDATQALRNARKDAGVDVVA